MISSGSGGHISRHATWQRTPHNQWHSWWAKRWIFWRTMYCWNALSSSRSTMSSSLSNVSGSLASRPVNSANCAPLVDVEHRLGVDPARQLVADEHAVLAAEPAADPPAAGEQPGAAEHVLEALGVLGAEGLRGLGEQLRVARPVDRSSHPRLAALRGVGPCQSCELVLLHAGGGCRRSTRDPGSTDQIRPRRALRVKSRSTRSRLARPATAPNVDRLDGVHDMGGMHGFGPVCTPDGGLTYHEPWELRPLAIACLIGSGLAPHDRRPRPGRLPRLQLLRSLAARRRAQAGRAGLPHAGRPRAMDGNTRRNARRRPRPPRAIPNRCARSEPASSPSCTPTSRHQRSRSVSPFACAACDRRRTIVAPDTSAAWWARSSGSAEPLPFRRAADDLECVYTVRFSSVDLFGDRSGDGEPPYVLLIDLWERYLEAA